MKTELVSIIIPTYNREAEVLECIDALLRITYSNFEIIVVDNASQDNTVSQIRKKFPTVRIVLLDKNHGVSRARNEGIKHAKGELLCFVDSDNIVDKDFISELVNLAVSDEKIGFVGPKMYYLNEPKKIWYAGAEIDLLTSRTRYFGINEIDEGQYDRVREVGHIPNVWLVKKSVIDKIGLIDTSYVMHYEESDWAMRAKQAGYKVMFCPSAIVYHNIPFSKERKSLRGLIGFDNEYRIFYAARNRKIFMKKYASKLNYIIYLIIFNNIFLIQYCLILLFYRRTDLMKSYLKGYLSGFVSKNNKISKMIII